MRTSMRIRNATFVICISHVAILCAQLLPSQPLPAFEVATVRPSQSQSAGVGFQVAPLHFRAENATVSDLIAFAYDLRSEAQLQGAPHWATSERFDLDAKIDDAQADETKKLTPSKQIDQYSLMLQSLLGERFLLQVHQRMQELPVYALEVAKGGPKLTPTASSQALPKLSGWSKGRVDAHAVPMSLFCQGLSGRDDLGGRIVIDATGPKGSYDFTLRWMPSAILAADASTSDNSALPLSTAIREQLGLKLTARRAKASVLIVDRIEHPSAN